MLPARSSSVFPSLALAGLTGYEYPNLGSMIWITSEDEADACAFLTITAEPGHMPKSDFVLLFGKPILVSRCRMATCSAPPDLQTALQACCEKSNEPKQTVLFRRGEAAFGMLLVLKNR